MWRRVEEAELAAEAAKEAEARVVVTRVVDTLSRDFFQAAPAPSQVFMLTDRERESIDRGAPGSASIDTTRVSFKGDASLESYDSYESAVDLADQAEEDAAASRAAASWTRR